MISLRTAAVAAAATATMAALTAAPAQAQPTPLPSALVLSVSQGDTPGGVPAQRTVWLSCSPVVAGSHPRADAACGELEAAGGDFNALRGKGLRFCPMIYLPVTLSADGIWNGAPVSYRQTYPNACQAANHSTYVFAF
jgi:hypothetical protein